MSHQQIIEQALSEIGLAEALVDQAKIKYYSARKKLEGIYSPASPKKGFVLTDAHKALLTEKRQRAILRIKNKS